MNIRIENVLAENMMIKDTITVREADTVRDVLNLMMSQTINGTPVVDEENNLKGMVVKSDIYKFLIDPGHYDTCPISWVMSKKVITGLRKDPLITIARKIRENDIVALPIVDEDNKLVGIISIEDLLDFFIDEIIK